MKYILCLIYLILSVAGLTFMKLGSTENAEVLFEVLGLKFTVRSIVGYVCYAISFLVYTIVITKFDLSYIIPILGGVINILILFIGITLLHEKYTLFSIVGSGMIIFGIVLMNIKK